MTKNILKSKLLMLLVICNASFAGSEKDIETKWQNCFDRAKTHWDGFQCTEISTKQWEEVIDKNFNLLKNKLSGDQEEKLIQAMKEWKDYKSKYNELIHTMDTWKEVKGRKTFPVKDYHLEAFLIVVKHQALLLEDLNGMLFDVDDGVTFETSQ